MPTATATMTHNNENTRAAFKSVVLPSKSTGLVGSTATAAGGVGGTWNGAVVGTGGVGVRGGAAAATTLTLRTLYNRATRSFLLRDVKLTCQLLETAFSIIQPPISTSMSLSKSIQSPSSSTSTSALALQEISTDDRRKWDILRITLESTVYASTLTPSEQSNLPESLRLVLQETPNNLVQKFYSRSLELFTPRYIVSGFGSGYGGFTQNGSTSGTGAEVNGNGNVALIPTQVLITLVLASLKVGCPDLGRIMIEDWLSKREQPSSSSFSSFSSSSDGNGRNGNGLSSEDGEDGDGDGYAKVLEVYCLHVLPKLSQWEYAVEFLEYESELGVRNRERLKTQLKLAYTNYLASLRKSSSSSPSSSSLSASSSTSTSSTPRPRSPATSSSSSSSSLSTTSTHTVVPNPRSSLNGHSNSHSRSNGHGYSRRSSSSSSKSDVTARAAPNGNGNGVVGVDITGGNDEIGAEGRAGGGEGGSRLPSLTNMNGHIRSRSKSQSKARTASSGSGSGGQSKLNGNAHVGAQMMNGHGLGGGRGNSTSTSTSSSSSTRSRNEMSTLELVQVVVKPYLTKRKLMMAFLVLVVFPILSLVVRRRRRRGLIGNNFSLSSSSINGEGGIMGSGGGGVSNVELVRRRLGGVEAGLVGKAWNEVVRVVLDTVKMAGSGLI